MTLVFDADDTLWANEARFHQAITEYVDWVAHPDFDEQAIRSLLHEVEVANIAAHGYGSQVFLRSLHDCVASIHGRPATQAERQEIADLVATVFAEPPPVFAGVEQTLAELGQRHDLRLLTKGSEEEQRGKIEASGLERFFTSTHVVREKDVDTYQKLAERLSFHLGVTWMIGNSPRSDIASARGAGWRAVFIPNEHTWAHEDVALDPDDPGVLRLGAITELPLHF